MLVKNAEEQRSFWTILRVFPQLRLPFQQKTKLQYKSKQPLTLMLSPSYQAMFRLTQQYTALIAAKQAGIASIKVQRYYRYRFEYYTTIRPSLRNKFSHLAYQVRVQKQKCWQLLNNLLEGTYAEFCSLASFRTV